MIIDTHCHFDAILSVQANLNESWLLSAQDLPAVSQIIQRAKNVGVEKFLFVGCDPLENENAVFVAQWAEEVYAVLGLHPTWCNSDWKEGFVRLKKLVEQYSGSKKLVGIGEIGLDFYHQPYDLIKQKDGFVAQIELALAHNLPISVHVRDAADELLKVLEPYRKELRGVIHCFSQSQSFAETVTGWNFLLGIGGPVTYPKNDALRDVLKNVGLDKLMLETDAPFLPPQKYRGKLNEPSYLGFVVSQLAEVFGCSEELVKQTTSRNAINLFGLK